MDTSSDKFISDKAKGEKLKFIFETLNKDKKRYDKIRDSRGLSLDENQEYEEICRKLKSFYEKCSIFIKTRKNGPGKFMVDFYINWCNSKDTKSNFLSNRIHDEFLSTNFEFHKQIQNSIDISNSVEKQKSQRPQLSPHAYTRRNDANFNIENQGRPPFPPQFRLSMNPANFIDPRNIQKFPNHSIMNHSAKTTTQLPPISSPYANTRNTQFQSRSPMTSDPQNYSSDTFQKFSSEKPGIANYPPNFNFENKSTFSSGELPTRLNNTFHNTNLQNSRLANPYMQNISSNPEQNGFLKESIHISNFPKDDTANKEHQQSYFANSSIGNSFNPTMIFRGSNQKVNQIDQNMITQDLIQQRHMNQSSFCDFAPNNFQRETRLTLEDIVPIGAEDFQISQSSIYTNKALEESSDINSLGNSSKLGVRSKSNSHSLFESEFDDLRRSPSQRLQPPINHQKQFQFESTKKYSHQPNFYPPRMMSSLNPSTMSSFRPSHNGLNPKKFSHFSQNQIIHHPNTPKEMHGDTSSKLASFHSSTSRKVISEQSPKNIIRAIRRNVSSDSPNETKSLNSSQSTPNTLKIAQVIENNFQDDRFLHRNLELGIFSTSNHKSIMHGFKINLKFGVLAKYISKIPSLERKVLSVEEEKLNLYYSNFDSMLHRILFVGFMIASGKKGSKLTPKDLEIAFKQTIKSQKFRKGN